MKNIILFISLSLLSSCYWRNGCFVSPQSVYCPRENVSDFDRYKKDGSTKEQKLRDIQSCGGNPDKYGNLFRQIREKNPGGNNDWKAVRKFANCMENKGYKYLERILTEI
ncbi:hypothetical protein [Stenoxybacter acetivorans]|uniref:hypothetical protein n=1 Tax=Stenoxybacter acetivorans TaxID=422441 RepID=UPI0012EB4876|nr:hypothetical protein [Stenoxybacter acetivorans]